MISHASARTCRPGDLAERPPGAAAAQGAGRSEAPQVVPAAVNSPFRGEGPPLRRTLHLALAAIVAVVAAPAIAAPAVTGPVRSAEAALTSLDARPYRAVVGYSLTIWVRGAGPGVRQFLGLRWWIAMRQTIESSTRAEVVFTAGPGRFRGVRVVAYDGALYVSRGRAPLRRAAGELRRFLLDVVFPAGGTHIVAAERLVPVTRSGKGRAHLRVHFDIRDQLATFARGFATTSRVPLAATHFLIKQADFRPDVGDVFVDPDTGLLAESIERYGVNLPLRAVVQATGGDTRGVVGTMLERGVVHMRVTAAEPVTVERPQAAGAISSRAFVGL
jgi:hypothetical protein